MIRTAFRSWFRLDRHDIRSSLPASLQPIVQNGLLYKAFQDALIPDFLYPMTATQRPWAGGLGDTTTFTRKGLLTPNVTPLVVGNDPTAKNYTVEQYSATMNQYADSMDTNLLQSAIAIVSKFIEDNQALATQAGRSLNWLSRNKLYAGYSGGTTWCTSVVTSATIVVNNTQGFGTVLVNGVPTPVSAGSPLSVTVNGVANTVVGVTNSTTLVLGSSVTTAVGQTVVAANAPTMIRRHTGTQVASRYNLQAGDVATLAMFRAAVRRLRGQAVPTINGTYVAHIDAATEDQLFADADFKQALTGRVDSQVFRNQSIGVIGGIDFVRNIEAPTTSDGGSGANLLIHQPIVMGAGALIAAPFENMGSLLSQVEGPQGAIEMITPAAGVQVAHIIRPPLDKLQQIVSSTWSYVGDYAVPTDSTAASGDPALYKRAVVLEHTDS